MSKIIEKIKEFGQLCWWCMGAIGLVLGLIFGAIAYDNTKADAAEVEKIQKNLATLTKLVTQDKLLQSIRETEAEIYKMDQEYKQKPMPAKELDHYIFLKGQLSKLMEMQKEQ